MLTRVEISKNALINNLKQFRKIVGVRIKIMAVVKSNAYGHGIIECAKIFEKNGADYLGVINLDEALLLKKHGVKKPIFILSYWEASTDYKSYTNIQIGIKKNIEFPVYTEEQIRVLAKISQKIKKKAKIHLKIDTGASRIGVLPENALYFARKCLKLTQLELRGVFTHFAKAESKNQCFTNKQTEKFDKIKQKLLKIKGFPQNALFHAGCTASTLNNSKTFFDMVRIGIGLYGLWPSSETKELSQKHWGRTEILKPALNWKTTVIQVKELSKKTFVGYDCTYQCQQKTKIAVLPVGYWDGYDRKQSNPAPLKFQRAGCGEVLIHGKRAPVIGRICMNMMMIDVSKIKNLRVGDEVILIGKDKNNNKKIKTNNEVTAEELAEKINSINYEIVTRINPQIPRIYK